MRLRAGLRVLRRTATEVQVGTDPRWAVRLPDLTPAEADLLQSVDARTDLTEVARLVAGRDVDPDRVRALVDVLVEARLTVGEPVPGRPARAGSRRRRRSGPCCVPTGTVPPSSGRARTGWSRSSDWARPASASLSGSPRRAWARCWWTTSGRCARPTSA